MKKPLLGLLLVAASLLSQAEPLRADQTTNPAEFAQKCASGCIVLDPSDVAKLQEGIQTALQGALEHGAMVGYQQGGLEALQALKTDKNLQREFCPKNI